MIIKSFTAETAAAALKQVRREMGGEAIVLRTRQLAGGPGVDRVEVTACLEKPSAYQSSEILNNRLDAATLSPQPESSRRTSNDHSAHAEAPEVTSRLKTLEEKLDRMLGGVPSPDASIELEGLDKVRSQLKDADLSDDLIASIIKSAALNLSSADDNTNAAHEELVTRLAELMEPNLTFQPGDRVAFIGPVGGGKSTMMGKVAAQLTFQVKQKVTLTSLDRSRIAATEEVQRYGRVLEAAVVEPSDLTDEAADTITLVDSPGLPHTAEGRDELRSALNSIQPTCRVAVIPATMRTSDAIASLDTLAPLAPTHLAMSMTDLTDRLGGVISVAAATGWKIALVSDAPAGISSVRPPDPDRTARRILKTEVTGE